MNLPADALRGEPTPLAHDAPTRPRPDWDEYFMQLVEAVSRRATCDRGRSGSIIVRDKRILCTGYVGSPPGFEHCDDVGHDFGKVVEDDGRVRMHCIRTIHAEQNALVQASRYGIQLDGATLYCTMEPCRVCAMLVASAGIIRVVAGARYHAADATRSIFRAAGVELDLVTHEYLYVDTNTERHPEDIT